MANKNHHCHQITKSDLLAIFLKHVLNQQALDYFTKLKKECARETYLQKAGQFIFDRIASHITADIQVTGLEHLRRHTPCLIAYPHKASILDGTLLNVLLLKEGINAKAIARVSTDDAPDSSRDHAYKMLADFIIPLKQKKSGNDYLPVKYRDMLAVLRKVYAHYKKNGAVLIAPEGKTNPHFMKQAKESLAGLSGKGRVPIIPCTIEYHHGLAANSLTHNVGGLYQYITFQFHDAVWADPTRVDNTQTLNAVMGAIASGYTCRFKGGCYRDHRPADLGMPVSVYINHLKRFDEKFDPIFRYVCSTEEKPDHRKSLFIGLLEEEFDVCLNGYYRYRAPAEFLDLDTSSAPSIKQVIKAKLAEKIQHQADPFTLSPHLAGKVSTAKGPTAASAT